ncbi:hypothetical protein C0Q88_07345 [Ralstonia pickettii]|uniref:Uncharacterized protein n=1 Tax=Ralstonia pickettii TaxID=329 RepID=A0A2N4TXR1_RALPI|nr:hypothetical protein [Ralstonia pickettii]PLC44485.1 hypothetical protein C0Q88_07345 [Ralstonia pickettii]
MRNDYSRERRRWDAISSRHRDIDQRFEDLFGLDGQFIIMDEEWPVEKPEPRRVEKVVTEAATGKAARRAQKRQRMQERIAEAQRRAHNEQNLGWGGW